MARPRPPAPPLVPPRRLGIGRFDGLTLDRRGLALRQLAHLELLTLDALDAQRQAAAGVVHLEDLHLELVAGADHLGGALDVVLRELGDVDQTLDAGQDLDEGAEGDDLGDLALDDVALLVLVEDALPGVLLRLLQAERDPLAVPVDVEDLDADGVADRERPRRDG